MILTAGPETERKVGILEFCRIRIPSWGRGASSAKALGKVAKPREGLAPPWCCSPGRDGTVPTSGGLQGVRITQRTLWAGLVVNQGFKILAQQPFPCFTVVFKWLLIKHSPVYVLMQRDLSPGTSPPIYYLYKHLTALTYFSSNTRHLFANQN